MQATRIRTLAALTLLASMAAAPASAHFFWAQIAPGSPAQLRVVFTEEPTESTLPSLLEWIESGRVRTGSEKALAWKRVEGALEAPLPAGARVAGMGYTWGVVEREQEGSPFLLQYYAKAARDGEATEPAGLHMELFTRRDGDAWVVSVRHGARPEAGAELMVYRPGEAQPLKLTTDARGEAKFTMSGRGLCAIRARAIEEERGEYGGKTYAQKRYYSTLTFPVPTAAQVAPSTSSARP